tara:strand:- start:159 stop:398 length:240 start_codon:yes stop_codon:yes gene_type:complete
MSQGLIFVLAFQRSKKGLIKSRFTLSLCVILRLLSLLFQAFCLSLGPLLLFKKVLILNGHLRLAITIKKEKGNFNVTIA